MFLFAAWYAVARSSQAWTLFGVAVTADFASLMSWLLDDDGLPNAETRISTMPPPTKASDVKIARTRAQRLVRFWSSSTGAHANTPLRAARHCAAGVGPQSAGGPEASA